MKHTPSVTAILVFLFVLSQFVGLALLANSITLTQTTEGTQVAYAETVMGERPDTSGGEAFFTLLIGGAIATGVLLLLARFKQYNIWKIWYFLAVFTSITVALETITPLIVALFGALILAIWKIFRNNMYVHNLSEVLVYSGISILLIPLFDLFWATMLLIVIALYDAYAVWKSKHMITLAKFQTETKQFAGLRIGYSQKNKSTQPEKKVPSPTMQPKESRDAILGGGDIAFPMIFIGSVFSWLLTRGISVASGFALSTIIIITATISLGLLFLLAKKDTFYPAMPFLTTGCFVGLGIVALIVV